MTITRDGERRRALDHALEVVRTRTFGVTDPLANDDVHRQHSPLMSPIVWDMGHIANFEEYWLLRQLDGRAPHDASLDELYNPFDNPRWVRADLPILSRPEATEYLDEVRGEARDLMRHTDLGSGAPLVKDGYVWNMVVQHEAQHQETVLQSLDLRTDLDPYEPASERALPISRRQVDDTDRVVIDGGPFAMGTDDRVMAYDNERPRHMVDVPSFAIDRFPVTARRYAEFVADGGYRRGELWSQEGRVWLADAGHETPQGWIPDIGGGWLVRRFGRVGPLDPREPVQHVSFHEAEAFAAWAGGRLPTEPEWEKAAAWDARSRSSRTYPWGDTLPTASHANLDHGVWGPAPVGSYPKGASAAGVEQMLGDVYEWTTSAFAGYPGYTTFPYPEYSEVFFGDDYRVLRGASWATSKWVARTTFRNWDHTIRRQIFSGLRLAWEVG
ncbi:MAG: ergothioneine biosynthesis protein EgtB [Acidimicrobiia bacterium]